MRPIFVMALIAAGLLGAGCSPTKSQEAQTEAVPSAAAEPGPAPIGSGIAGGATPMTGTESVGGSSGGGVQQSAMGAARDAASKASAGTVGAEASTGSDSGY